MKKVYWRPRAVSRTALILIAVLSVVSLLVVEQVRVVRERPHYDEKMAATELARTAMERIYAERKRQGPAIDPTVDPAQTGLIGVPMSQVTSISGNLASKQTSANPNFAAVIVDMLKRVDVEEGDVVAVGCSGSFPALNICTYAALETLNARPIVITSAAASQWGANVPHLLWIDMERILEKEGIFDIRAVASSIGGYEDQGLGLSEPGLLAIREGIKRNGLTLIEPSSFEESIEARMKIYQQRAGRRKIKAYINIGGGTVSTGRSLGKKMFQPGLNRQSPGRVQRIDGIMPRLITQDVPVIHLVQIMELAERYGLQIAPTTAPEVGDGDVFIGTDYNRPLAATTLAIILASLYGFIRSDVGFRLFRMGGPKKQAGYLEPMV
jgi:poly-gamma-glutamate system protein